MSQWATNVPTALKVRWQVHAAVVALAGQLGDVSAQSTLCSRLPAALVTVTVSPTVIDTELGLKLALLADAVTDLSEAVASPATRASIASAPGTASVTDAF